MTYQRAWQLKMASLGRCQICGGVPLQTRVHCRRHAQIKSDRVKERRVRLGGYDPIKRRAHWIIESAIRSGRLLRPPECSRCGIADPKINAHHHDYTKPFDVEWLCYRCHAIVEGRGQK